MKGCNHQENPDIMCLRMKESNTIYSFAKEIQRESDSASGSRGPCAENRTEDQNRIMSVQNPDYGVLCKPNGLDSSTDNLKERDRMRVEGEEGV